MRYLIDRNDAAHVLIYSRAHQRDKTALMAAAEIANTDCVRVLLEAGADIHAADNVRG